MCSFSGDDSTTVLLANEPIDLINSNDYEVLHREFVNSEEEDNSATKPPVGLAPILQQGWERGTFWCSPALNSPMALFRIFYDHIQPRFSASHKGDSKLGIMTMPYCMFNTLDFLERQVREKEEYDMRLREAFQPRGSDD